MADAPAKAPPSPKAPGTPAKARPKVAPAAAKAAKAAKAVKTAAAPPPQSADYGATGTAGKLPAHAPPQKEPMRAGKPLPEIFPTSLREFQIVFEAKGVEALRKGVPLLAKPRERASQRGSFFGPGAQSFSEVGRRRI